MRVWTAGAKQRALCDGMPASCRYGDGGADEGKANVSQGRVGSGRVGKVVWRGWWLFCFEQRRQISEAGRGRGSTEKA